jgi:hypothetical protein
LSDLNSFPLSFAKPAVPHRLQISGQQSAQVVRADGKLNSLPNIEKKEPIIHSILLFQMPIDFHNTISKNERREGQTLNAQTNKQMLLKCLVKIFKNLRKLRKKPKKQVSFPNAMHVIRWDLLVIH